MSRYTAHMDTDFETLCARAGESSATVLDNLTHIETALTELQREVAGLPFFVRGFVSSEVTRGTGQDVPAWAQSVGNLTAALREAEAAVERTRAANTVSDADRSIMGQAAERIEAERPRLEGLAGFMEKVPSRVNSIPAGLLPADKRGEFLGVVEQQVQALRGALAAMPNLAQSLAALAG